MLPNKLGQVFRRRNLFSRRQKAKGRESSKTRFGKVSRKLERHTRGVMKIFTRQSDEINYFHPLIPLSSSKNFLEIEISKIGQTHQMHSYASECIRMRPKRFERVRTGPSTSENFDKLANTVEMIQKTCENFRKTLRKLQARDSPHVDVDVDVDADAK